MLCLMPSHPRELSKKNSIRKALHLNKVALKNGVILILGYKGKG